MLPARIIAIPSTRIRANTGTFTSDRGCEPIRASRASLGHKAVGQW